MSYADQHAAPVTVATLARMKREGRKIAMLTAYDASFAQAAEAAGAEVILVGDSLGMVVQGHDTTLPVSVDDILYHTRLVARGRSHALLMADLPFMSYPNVERALDNAARLVREGGAQMVKLEGGGAQADIVAALAGQGIPVCAHLGLRPQSVHKLGGYRVQGRDSATATAMIEDAGTLAAAGADLLLLECVPAVLAAEITRAVDIPVIGIGAGNACDGQVLVVYDVLGISPGKLPKFAKNFLAGRGSVQEALEAYVAAVKNGRFPAPEHAF